MKFSSASSSPAMTHMAGWLHVTTGLVYVQYICADVPQCYMRIRGKGSLSIKTQRNSKQKEKKKRVLVGCVDHHHTPKCFMSIKEKKRERKRHPAQSQHLSEPSVVPTIPIHLVTPRRGLLKLRGLAVPATRVGEAPLRMCLC